MNGTGSVSEGLSSSRCSVEQQHMPGRNHATSVITRMKWTKEVNVAVMECFYLSKPFTEEGKPIRGYRQRMHRIWKERELFSVSEQRLCDQARMIRKNEWLTAIELEEIRRRVIQEEEKGEENLEMNTATVGKGEENDNNSKDCTDGTSSGQGTENIEEESNVNKQSANTENIVLNDFENASNEEKEMVRKIVELMNNPDREVDYDFRKVNKIRVVEETRKVNKVLKYIATSNITETNRLLKAVSMLVAERIGIKKKNTTKRNTEPW